MSLEAMSSEQFMNFVRFARAEAQAGRNTSVARLGAQDALGTYDISAGNDDRVGAFRRSARSKRSNDDIRAEFKACVVNMFGGAPNVPKSVAEALKLDDYGEGKPLTARRILKVAEKVAPLAERLAAAKARALAALNQDADNPAVAKLVDVALKRCIGDADATDLVVNSIKNVVIGTLGPRREEDVISRVDRFVASAADLRKAAKGNAAIMESGKRFFREYGKPVEPGMVAKMVRAAHAMSLGPLKRLSANSSVVDLYKGVSCLSRKVDAAVVKTGAKDLLEGADEEFAVKVFFAELALEHCGAAAVRRISDSMRGDAAAELYTFLDDVFYKKLCAEGASAGLKQNASEAGDLDRAMMGCIVRAADDILGQDSGFEFNSDDAISEGLGEKESTATMLTDIYARGIEAGENFRVGFMKKFIHGKGPGANLLERVYTQRIGEYPEHPLQMFCKKASDTAHALLKWTLASECRLMAQGRMNETKFAQSLASRLVVKLPDGKVLSKNLDEACGQIASFVTKGRVESYAKLRGEARVKAHVVMSLLSMETAKVATDGHYIAATENTFVPAVTEHSDPAKDVHEISIGFDREGGFVLAYTGTKSLTSLEARVNDDEGGVETQTVNVARGSKSEAKLTLTIVRDEMDRLAKLDFAEFDDTAAVEARDEGDAEPTYVVQQLDRKFRANGICVLDNATTFA